MNTFSRWKTCCAIGLLLICFPIHLMADGDQKQAVPEQVQPVGLADWPTLARALAFKPVADGRIVSFRELWEMNPSEVSEPLAISGLVVRRFKRQPVGQFPALEELWIRTDDDGLVMVTNRSKAAPTQGALDLTAPGMALEIQARMIRKVLYESTDEPRIAPWLVAQRVSVKGSSEGATESKEDSGESQKLIFLIFSIISATATLRLVLAFAARSGRSGKAG
jgi:hypothetical protein